MIEVQFREAGDKLAVEVSGHAFSGNKGEDLVCCSVSTLLDNWYLATHVLGDSQPEVEKKDGYFKGSVSATSITHLFYDSLKMSLWVIAKEHTQNIKINTEAQDGS